MKNDKDKLIEQSEAQQSPRLAKAEDFKIKTADEAANQSVPGHGQHGQSAREYNALLKHGARQPGKSRFSGQGAPLPTVAR
jgi:hypothetical protein